VQDQVWIFWERENSLPTTETRTPDLLGYILVATILRLGDKIVGKDNAEELIQKQDLC